MIRRRPALKELQEKKYLFPDLNLPGMLDDLENGVIQLLEPLLTPNTAVIIGW